MKIHNFKPMKFRFEKKYFLFFIPLLIGLTLIALFVKNPLFRGSFGDILVIGMLYCLVQSFMELDKKWTIIGIGIFAVLIEISQAFHLLKILNLDNNQLLTIVLGNHFDFNDIWSYLIGCVLVYMLEFNDDGTRPRRKKFLGF